MTHKKINYYNKCYNDTTNTFGNNDLNKYKLNNWMQTTAPIVTLLYYGKIYNPPYFNNIISLIENNLEEVHKIWNMILNEGYFIISYKSNAFVHKIHNLTIGRFVGEIFY